MFQTTKNHFYVPCAVRQLAHQHGPLGLSPRQVPTKFGQLPPSSCRDIAFSPSSDAKKATLSALPGSWFSSSGASRDRMKVGFSSKHIPVTSTTCSAKIRGCPVPCGVCKVPQTPKNTPKTREPRFVPILTTLPSDPQDVSRRVELGTGAPSDA